MCMHPYIFLFLSSLCPCTTVDGTLVESLLTQKLKGHLL